MPALPSEPFFAIDATATDGYFRNGIALGATTGEVGDGEILHVFDEGAYTEIAVVETAVPVDAVRPGEPVALTVLAGTKAAPGIDPDENNDDFLVRDPRLVLPDGRVLRPAGGDPEQWLRMGDSEGRLDLLASSFEIPTDAFTAQRALWSTVGLPDGEHRLEARDGERRAAATVLVDGTAPEITTPIEPRRYQGAFTIDATAADAGSGLAALEARLDGEPIALPYETSSLLLQPGEHELVLTARDRLGNEGSRTVVFSTPQEAPSVEPLVPAGPASGAAPTPGVRAEDPTGDPLVIELARGIRLAPGDGVTASAGLAHDADDVDRGRAISAADPSLVAEDDGRLLTTGSASALPYHLFDVRAPEEPGAELRLRWSGEADAGALLRLLVRDEEGEAWREVDRMRADEAGDAALEASLPIADAGKDGRLQALVQHSLGWAGPDLSDRDSAVAANHPGDEPRSGYDATIAWESDTQYYNASPLLVDRQASMHDYLLRERGNLNLQYLVHTGDIVDQSEEPEQWDRAEPSYAALDEAGLPYGVLAGNHDVNQLTNDYTQYGLRFGEERFAGSPWYAASHEDNRGHVDLIRAGGIDWMLLFMGWNPGDEQIDWMNAQLAEHPDRIAVLALHEFMLTTGGLGPGPQRILDEVVATNPNVRFVLSGHYHDAFTRLDSFDDDGDGVDDRTVTSMLFDYQGLEEGGQGYLRLLHLDNAGERILVRTYSDYERDYDAEHPVLDAEHQRFEIPYAQAGIEPGAKTLATDALRVEVLTRDVLARAVDPADGELRADAGEGIAWYARASDPHGGVAVTDVQPASG